MATVIALLGYAFARNASPETVATFNRFGQAAGILNRVLTVMDSIRVVAVWFSNGETGSGPLGVPSPVVGKTTTHRTMPDRLNTNDPSTYVDGIGI